MCGRFTFDIPPELLAAIFGLREVPELTPSYNVAPTQQVAVVRQVSDHNSLKLMKWGLVPPWSKDPAIGSQMINARSETVAEKPSFRHAIMYRRCIVPASGFFDWKHEGRSQNALLLPDEGWPPLGLRRHLGGMEGSRTVPSWIPSPSSPRRPTGWSSLSTSGCP